MLSNKRVTLSEGLNQLQIVTVMPLKSSTIDFTSVDFVKQFIKQYRDNCLDINKLTLNQCREEDDAF
jgi:hypothetical protein